MVFSTLGLLAGSALTAAAADPPLRIKNGHKMKVVLGKTHEDAQGIRPANKVWTLELGADMVGAAAELEDVTPRWQPVRLKVPIETQRVVLDEERFLPDHVYRMEVWRARQLVGSALVYLYPPPVERVHRVEFEGAPKQPARRDRSSAPAVSPKRGP